MRQMEAQELQTLDQETLDRLVTDAKSEEASQINNAGQQAQMDYLTAPNLSENLVQAVLRVDVQFRWDSIMADRDYDKETPSTRWSDLARAQQLEIAERVSDAIGNSSIPEIVSDIVFYVTTSFLPVRDVMDLNKEE